MANVCNRCKENFHCCLTYGSKPCKKNRDVEPVNFDIIKDFDIDEMAEFLSTYAGKDKEQIKEWLQTEI